MSYQESVKGLTYSSPTIPDDSEPTVPNLSLKMASSSTSVKPSVGILSIGDMGMGIAKLLLANDYEVLTVSAGRRQVTASHTFTRLTE